MKPSPTKQSDVSPATPSSDNACLSESVRSLRAVLASRYDPREAAAIAQWLLEAVAGVGRTQQLTHPEMSLPAAVRQQLAVAARRVAAGEPVQYVVGYETFLGRRFAVNAATLIPRPETAELVTWILEEKPSWAGAVEALSLLDVGTGSGCIAISLAAALPAARVTALDVSPAALLTARDNAAALGVRNVTFVEGDILAMSAAATRGDTPLDLIVSNPPYVTRSEAAEMSPVVLDHEPPTALFVPDDDALRFYRAIARYGRRHLRAEGRLYFEINARFGAATCRLLADEGYADIVLRQDLSGRDRMVRASLATLS